MKPTTAYKLQSISYKHISLLLHVHVSAILVAIFREVSTKDYRKFQNHCKHKMKFHIYGLKYVLKYKINVFYFRMVTYHTILSTVLYILIYRGADKSLARPGKKQARKHVRDARDFNNIERPAVIKFPPPPPPPPPPTQPVKVIVKSWHECSRCHSVPQRSVTRECHRALTLHAPPIQHAVYSQADSRHAK